MTNYKIKNPQVKYLYNYYKNIFDDKTMYRENRVEAYNKIELIKGMITIYELNKKLDKEELKDLLSTNYYPLFPETRQKLEERLNFITFKKWLDSTLMININAIKENNINLLDDYEQLLIKSQNFNMKFNHIPNQDSINRFNSILDITKEEYNEITLGEKNKDIVFYNRLLGWYEDNFDEITLFARNLKLID